ncbi:hypothetical protein [Nocardioides sp. GXZ039]|uniref:hypothetical protein n=1 Tax=Nocardioides sp. GXZ039 TaxID=3136018 RepID=UPI0030F3B910
MTGDNPHGETFTPTSGRVFGVIAVLLGVTAVGAGLFASDDVVWGMVAFGIFFTALAWAAMLRPGVAIRGDRLVLRNLVDTVSIPLAGIEEVAVRQVLAVRVGERRYTCAAIGRSRRQLRRADRAPRPDGEVETSGREEAERLAQQAYGEWVQERIRQLAEQAREEQGIAPYSAAQGALAADVTRRWAYPEIAVLVISAIATVVFILT